MCSRTVTDIAYASSDASTVEDGATDEGIAGWISVCTFAVARACCSGQGGRTQQGWCHAYAIGA